MANSKIDISPEKMCAVYEIIVRHGADAYFNRNKRDLFREMCEAVCFENTAPSGLKSFTEDQWATLKQRLLRCWNIERYCGPRLMFDQLEDEIHACLGFWYGIYHYNRVTGEVETYHLHITPDNDRFFEIDKNSEIKATILVEILCDDDGLRAKFEQNHPGVPFRPSTIRFFEIDQVFQDGRPLRDWVRSYDDAREKVGIEPLRMDVSIQNGIAYYEPHIRDVIEDIFVSEFLLIDGLEGENTLDEFVENMVQVAIGDNWSIHPEEGLADLYAEIQEALEEHPLVIRRAVSEDEDL